MIARLLHLIDRISLEIVPSSDLTFTDGRVVPLTAAIRIVRINPSWKVNRVVWRRVK